MTAEARLGRRAAILTAAEAALADPHADDVLLETACRAVLRLSPDHVLRSRASGLLRVLAPFDGEAR